MLRVESVEGEAIEVWTVDRPEVANALDQATFQALDRAITAAEIRIAAGALRGIVLAGAPRGKPGAREVFLAGADLREVAALARDGDALAAARFAEETGRTIDRLAALDAPVVAAIAGDVYGGGCEVALACDLRVAEDGVRIAFRQARIGVACAWGGSIRLPRLVGLGAAKHLLLTALPCEVERALRIGLVDEVVPRGAARERAIALVRAVAEGAPTAIVALKRSLDEASPDPARERARFVEVWRGEEHREALAARHEKRPPRWARG